jgi:hypothetical protein
MTLADHLKGMLHTFGMKPAEIEECLPHVIQTLKHDKSFTENLDFDIDCFEQPLQNFTLREMTFMFTSIVLPEAFRWLNYRYYDTLNNDYHPK